MRYRLLKEDLFHVTRGGIDTAQKAVEACRTLLRKEILLEEGRVSTGFGFIAEYRVGGVDGEEHLEIVFADGLKRLVNNLIETGHYTRYSLEIARNLRSSYSMRLYEVLKSEPWKTTPVTIEVASLKRRLDIPDDSPTYGRFTDFRRLILDKGQADLQAGTDISFTWTPVKTGKKVTAIRFVITKNRSWKSALDVVEATAEPPVEPTVEPTVEATTIPATEANVTPAIKAETIPSTHPTADPIVDPLEPTLADLQRLCWREMTTEADSTPAAEASRSEHLPKASVAMSREEMNQRYWEAEERKKLIQESAKHPPNLYVYPDER